MRSSHSLVELEQSQASARAGVAKPLKNLALLLLALNNPAAAFAPSNLRPVAGHGHKSAVNNTYGVRAGSHSAVWMRQTDDIRDDFQSDYLLDGGTSTRRVLLRTALALPLAASLQPAEAFENRLPPDEFMLKYKTPQQPGPMPTDIGIQSSGANALKPCTDGKPHCFSSSPVEDEDLNNADFWGVLVDPFKYDKPLAEAFADVKDAVAAYQVGQRGIDGGGFKLVSESTKGEVAYVYAQFQSLRKGYIDDMEFAMSSGTCNVRTSSRLGYADSGVNAKRYEWFADALKSKGWKTTPLRNKGHEGYFEENGITDSDMTKTDAPTVQRVGF